MKQKDLAKKLGIAPSTLNELIHRKARWDLERAIYFALAIEKPVSFLLTADVKEIKDAIKCAGNGNG